TGKSHNLKNYKEHTMKKTTRLAQLGLAASVAAVAFAPLDSFAIANWARKYKVDCVTCHDPAVPRLNALGHQFRKMGYRMDTEVQAGKPEAYKEIGNFLDRKSTRLNSSHVSISYAVFCLKKKNNKKSSS